MRKLFIGSSTEGLPIAERLKAKLEKELYDFIECTIWNDGKIFSLNKSALDSLVVAARKFDYGILIATKDDIATVRGTEVYLPRDNVMFEMGMFLGSLGLTRAFLMTEKASKLPTDYNGVTVPYFESDVDGSLDRAIEQIAEVMLNSKNSFNIRPVPSAALALSYFDNFVQRVAQKLLRDDIDFTLKVLLPKSLENVYTYIDYYKKYNKSEEVSVYEKGTRPFVYKLKEEVNTYWDIPTTLTTLNKLINLVIPSKEIGVEEDKQDWIEQELRNFKGTIEILVELCPACKGNVVVQFLK
ncbi:MAG TPA: TIR domain-containing protein [Segetibacter sp.]|jgi:hypothetical protein